jgi:hypothetical protein
MRGSYVPTVLVDLTRTGYDAHCRGDDDDDGDDGDTKYIYPERAHANRAACQFAIAPRA